MKKIFTLCFLIGLAKILFAQTDTSCALRITLLTCSPGEELYTSWGHSALRVENRSNHSDLIYNYGTFDFDDPSFYSKFIQGKLLYFVSVDSFENFVYEYRYYQRGITEQVLNLSCEEKQRLSAALQVNAMEANKYYKYDFLSDNCTTRLRDMVFKNLNGAITTGNILPHLNITFRNLIHQYLDSGSEYWSKLGIDILLGEPLDKEITNNEAMFLPDYLMMGFDSTSISEKRLVAQKTNVLTPTLAKSERPFLRPFSVFLILFLAIAALSISGRAGQFLSIFDIGLFLITGLLGIFLVFMWFGTDHPECRNNFNIAWAFPLNSIAAFFIYRKQSGWQYYFLSLSFLLIAVLIGWKWLPQEMDNALIPVVGLLIFRSFTRYKIARYGS